MKRLLFSVLALLMACGLAWADGFTVSGTIKVMARGSETVPNSEDSVILSNATVRKVAMVDIVEDEGTHARTCTYSFSDVEAGEYTVTYTGFVWGLDVQGTASVTVSDADVVCDITAAADYSHVDLQICPQYMVDYGYYSSPMNLVGVSVTCKVKNESGDGETKTSTSSGVTFEKLDTANVYTITLHKDGYKDSVFDTKAYRISGSEVQGMTVYVQMKEDLGNQVTLKGNVSVKDMPDAQLNGLYLQVVWANKTYQTQIINGSYQFTDLIPVGKIVYKLCINTGSDYYPNYEPVRNWWFETSHSDTLPYTLTGDDKSTVTNDLTVSRVGTDISGAVVDSSSTYPSSLTGVVVILSSDQSKDSVNTGNGSNFSFSGVKDGTYTLTLTKAGYTSEPKTITVNLANMKLDSTIQLGNIAMNPSESDFTISGTAYYYDDEMVYLNHAKVVCYSDADYTTKLDSTYTDENGAWSITVRCFPSTTLYLVVFHEDIEPGSGVISRLAQYMVGTSVTIYCEKKMPDVYGMINYKAKQDFAAEKPTVNLTWEWPEGLTENYGTTYVIYTVQVLRKQNDGDFAVIALLEPRRDTLPVSFVDTVATSSDTLKIGNTYTYEFIVGYSTPYKSIKVEDANLLTVNLLAEEPSYFNLTLNVNDDEMGTVTGAGEYVAGTEVTIKATARQGYDFVAWLHNTDTVAKTAEHKVVLISDSTLTAVFVANGTPVVPDSVTLTLAANDDKMGKVEGAGKYEKNTEVTIKATANDGYVFVAWMSGSDTVGMTAEYKLTLVSDSSLTAVFVVKTANEEREQAAWNVYVENQTIVLRSDAACQYDVYHVSGALVKRAKTNANEYRIAVSNSGLYIIRRISATGISVKKVMVR